MTGPVQNIDNEDWNKLFDALVHPLMYLVRAVAPQMLERKSGKIIAVTSAAPSKRHRQQRRLLRRAWSTKRIHQGCWTRNGAQQRSCQCHRPELYQQQYLLPRQHSRQ